jgi:protein-S-isoprenylcysteine O-methyltransferase Ste14
MGSASLVYLIAFLFNLLPDIGPIHGIDSGETGNPYLAFAINAVLIVLFGLQHSVMARPRFKRWLAKYLPPAAERASYMLGTAVVVFALCLFWQPQTAVVWQANNGMLHNGLLAIGLAGWVLVLYATFLINHFDLFGLRQVWMHFRGREYTHLPFQVNALYRFIRHPIMTSAFIGIWVTPVMTVGHLVLALGMSVYILIGVYHEEKDLIRAFGNRYMRYRRETGRFLPRFSTSTRRINSARART